MAAVEKAAALWNIIDLFSDSKKKQRFLRPIATEIWSLGRWIDIQFLSTESGIPEGRAQRERGGPWSATCFCHFIGQEGSGRGLHWILLSRTGAILPKVEPSEKNVTSVIGAQLPYLCSNFPISVLSTLGETQASALAAGCPSIVKKSPNACRKQENCSLCYAEAAKKDRMPDWAFFSNLTVVIWR